VHEKQWGLLLGLRNQVGEYVSVLGLSVVVDEAEGYAYLRSQVVDQDATEFPRLVARRTLPFKVSVLLALLRKRLAEFDASSSDVRLVLSRDQIIELLRLFMPDSPTRRAWWTTSIPPSRESANWAFCTRSEASRTGMKSDGF